MAGMCVPYSAHDWPCMCNTILLGILHIYRWTMTHPNVFCLLCNHHLIAPEGFLPTYPIFPQFITAGTSQTMCWTGRHWKGTPVIYPLGDM